MSDLRSFVPGLSPLSRLLRSSALVAFRRSGWSTFHAPLVLYRSPMSLRVIQDVCFQHNFSSNLQLAALYLQFVSFPPLVSYWSLDVQSPWSGLSHMTLPVVSQLFASTIQHTRVPWSRCLPLAASLFPSLPAVVPIHIRLLCSIVLPYYLLNVSHVCHASFYLIKCQDIYHTLLHFFIRQDDTVLYPIYNTLLSLLIIPNTPSCLITSLYRCLSISHPTPWKLIMPCESYIIIPHHASS